MFENLKNHKREVEAYQKLDMVNREVSKRTKDLNDLTDYLARLNDIIDSILAKNPDLSEEEAISAHIASLKSENAELENQNSALKAKMEEYEREIELLREAHKYLRSISLEREALESELADLKRLRNETFDPAAILLIAYTDLDENVLCSNLFFYNYKSQYETSDKSEEKKEGSIYTSIDFDRTIGFASDNKTSLIGNEINALPKLSLTFAEVCQTIGSKAYLKKRISLSEVTKVREAFLRKYCFDYVDDKAILKRTKRED